MFSRACTSYRPAGPTATRPLRVVKLIPTLRILVLGSATSEPMEKVDVAVEEDYDGPDVLPSTQQVTNFINSFCNGTEIAEVQLKMGNFELKVKRSVPGAAIAAPVLSAPAVPYVLPAAVPSPVLAMDSTAPSSVEDTVDESLVYVNSPKVGIFRRGKYSGGKRVGKGNLVELGTSVKKGQTLGYVEQLGTFVEVKTPIAGELAKMHLEDGAPVAYNQVIAEVAPFFGGHIIGDSKYA